MQSCVWTSGLDIAEAGRQQELGRVQEGKPSARIFNLSRFYEICGHCKPCYFWPVEGGGVEGIMLKIKHES
jgi:hypothetical protein